jgi:acid phosphatase family membrane protein YuiD
MQNVLTSHYQAQGVQAVAINQITKTVQNVDTQQDQKKLKLKAQHKNI